MQEKVFNLIFDQDEITWQTLLYELMRSEDMDPWDVDVSVLTKKYIDILKKLRQMDCRVSGKVLLSAAILLKIKSNRLIGEDLDHFDSLLSGEDEDDFEEEQGPVSGGIVFDKDTQGLIPKTPQPRKRKVSIYDLVDALQAALEVKRRRVLSQMRETTIEIPENKFDLGDIMHQVYRRILTYFRKSEGQLTFTHLVPGNTKTEKIHTFIPLLHLTNDRKIDLVQDEHFGEIGVLLNLNHEDVKNDLGEI